MSLFQHRQLAPTAFSFIQLCLLLCASSLPPNIFGRGMELKTQVRGVLFPWLFLSRPFLCVCLSLASSCWRSAFSLSRTRIRSIGCRCQSYCRINKFSPFFLTQAGLTTVSMTHRFGFSLVGGCLPWSLGEHWDQSLIFPPAMVSRYVQPWHRNVHIITLEHFQPLLAPFRPQLPSFRLDMQVEVSWSRSQDNTTQEMLRKKKCPYKITLDRQRTQPACLPRPLRIEETGKRSEGSLQQAMLLDTTHSCARFPHVA
ncbi:hypothetical protein CSPX01_16441 [Colletotrichum filicis]|nr:hypothetical protein CSPX01_16441 [Colletotrichum filicis]